MFKDTVTLHAREYWGKAVLVHWHQLTHQAFGGFNDKNEVFRTRCGLMFRIAAAPMPWARCITCFACIVKKEI